MEITQSGTSPAGAVVNRLVEATNEHDLDALVGCFALDYVNETPAHPTRGFTGSDQVRRNWTQIFEAVPDLAAEIVGLAEGRTSAENETADTTVWTEWQTTGTRRDGAPHLMRGVIIFAIHHDQIAGARFYLEPVEMLSGTVDAAIASGLADRA